MKFLALALAVLAMILSSCGEPAKFNATDITGADWGKDFALIDHNGKPRRLADFKGKAVVLFFGYTQCPDVCPTTLAAMRDTMRLLGADAARVQVLFATLDPSRDTPHLLAQYVPWFDPSFLGLWGDEQTIAATARDFKVYYAKQPGAEPGSYSIDHTAASYVFDPQGRLRLTIRHGEAPERIAADLRQLLAGK
ncbi:MAG: SCO family protein [Rhodocyclaceae bacterium]|nr:SCO family protein [Rhodocyclaceae bacterium]